jgi:hypothetical protein
MGRPGNRPLTTASDLAVDGAQATGGDLEAGDRLGAVAGSRAGDRVAADRVPSWTCKCPVELLVTVSVVARLPPCRVTVAPAIAAPPVVVTVPVPAYTLAGRDPP